MIWSDCCTALHEVASFTPPFPSCFLLSVLAISHWEVQEDEMQCLACSFVVSADIKKKEK